MSEGGRVVVLEAEDRLTGSSEEGRARTMHATSARHKAIVETNLQPPQRSNSLDMIQSVQKSHLWTTRSSQPCALLPDITTLL